MMERVVLPAGQYRTTRTLNVRQWGAVGDGVADDTDAIQEAINRAIPGPIHVRTAAFIHLMCACGQEFFGSGDQEVRAAEMAAKAHFDTCAIAHERLAVDYR